MATLESERTEATLTQKAVSGTAWSSVATATRQILSVASVATVGRALGPGAYGVMGMANLLMVFILTFRDLGTGSAIVQRQTLNDKLLSSLFWVNFVLGIALASIVCGTSPAVAAFFNTPQLIPILCTLSISFWLTSCGVVHNSLLFREMKFKAVAAADIAAGVCTYLVALTCAYRGFGVWSLVFANLTNAFVATAGYWLGSRWRPKREFDSQEARSVARYSLNLSGFGLVNYFSRNADNITVGKILGRAPLGDYQMAYNMMLTPIQNISSVIAQATFPAFARIQNDAERFRFAWVRSCMLIALITFPVMTGLGIVADPLIRAVLGVKWVGAIPIFQVLAPVGMIQSVQTTVGIIYMSKGRTDWMFRFGVVQGIVLVTAFLLGIRFGILGVAVAYCAAYFGVTMIPGFIIPFKLIGLKLSSFFRALLPQIAITVAMASACWLFMRLLRAHGVENNWVLLCSTILSGATLYVVLMLAFWPPVMDHLRAALTSSGRSALSGRIVRLRRLGFGASNVEIL